jgi:DHA1 family bicyclomycin/chloramphenicol resistance-like MFS transporter
LIGAAMEPFPNNAGMASSCQMFIQFLFMGLTAGVVAPLAWGSLLHLAWAHGALVLTGFLILLWQRQATSKA